MTNSANAEDRTLRIVLDLEQFERAAYVGEPPDALVLIDGEPWTWEPVGCVVCVGAELESVSFAHHERPGTFRCLRCGPLVELPYKMTKHYRVSVGSVVRENEQSAVDSMLFPASMSPAEHDALIEKFLDEAEQEEQEADDFAT